MIKFLITFAFTLSFITPVDAATRAEWDACIDETQTHLFAKGMCGTTNCFDEKNRSLVTICRDKVGPPPHPNHEAEQLIEALRENNASEVDLDNAEGYQEDSQVGRALAAYWERSKHEISEMQKRNRSIKDWRFTQDGEFITIEGTTNISGKLISAAVSCDGEYVGNALGGVRGGGTFTMIINNVPQHCSEISLSRISVE